MNRRPGQVDVVTEVGYCPSCGRTRNLRREDHHLGTLVRTIVTCETCHRTLSSSIGVAAEQPIQAQPVEPAPESTATPAPAPKPKAVAKKPTTAAKKPAVSKKPATVKKPVARKPAGKPKSTATRKPTRTK